MRATKTIGNGMVSGGNAIGSTTGNQSFFRAKSIGLSTRMGRKPQTLLVAACHNKREIGQSMGSRKNINPAKSHLNRTTFGPDTAEGVVAMAKTRMDSIGFVPTRRDYTQAIELLISLPHGTAIDAPTYFDQCQSLVIEKFGAENILSVDVHRDEPQSHLHILVAPIRGNKYWGSKLLAKVHYKVLAAAFARLGASHGLDAPTRRLCGPARDQAFEFLLNHLESTQDPILTSLYWPAIKCDFKNNVVKYAALIGLRLPEFAPPIRHINLTSDGDSIPPPPNSGTIVSISSKPMGFESNEADKVVKTLGFEPSSLQITLEPSGLNIVQEADWKAFETLPVLASTGAAQLSDPFFPRSADVVPGSLGRQPCRRELPFQIQVLHRGGQGYRLWHTLRCWPGIVATVFRHLA